MRGDKQRLQHDVGKYLTRMAINLSPAPLSGGFIELLLRDLYEAPGGGRPAHRFESLAHAIDSSSAERIAAAFVALDALEPTVRAHDQAAAREAARIALDISRTIDEAEERA